MNVVDSRALLWKAGLIASWYLRPSQLDIYELLLVSKRPHVECARQFGKTTSIICYVLEMLIQNPGWICRWCEPWKEQCKEIVIPQIDKIQSLLPDNVNKFKFSHDGTKYTFANSSKLYLRGVNEDRGESSRGPHAHIIVADEFGSWKNPRYIVDEVLKPQLETTDGPFIFASTPPEDLGHLYYAYADRAEYENRFIQKIIYDNESLSAERIEEIKQDCGGDRSLAWRRERLCERIKNPEKVVVAEYEEHRNDVPDEYLRPQFFHAYVGGDSGADDNTAVLYAYHDFLKDEIVFEDELVLNGQTTKTIIDYSKEKELKLWGTQSCSCIYDYPSIGPKVCLKHGLQPYRRVYDANKQLVYDIAKEMKYYVEVPEKDDRIAAINYFKILVQQGKIKIKKRCRILRRQIKVGQWANDKHTDFERKADDPELKHLDALAGAIYLVRSIIRTSNPYPQNVGVSYASHHVNPSTGPKTQEEKDLVQIFESFSGGL